MASLGSLGTFWCPKGNKVETAPGLLLPESSNETGSGVFLFSALPFCHFKRNPQKKSVRVGEPTGPPSPSWKGHAEVGEAGHKPLSAPLQQHTGCKKKKN